MLRSHNGFHRGKQRKAVEFSVPSPELYTQSSLTVSKTGRLEKSYPKAQSVWVARDINVRRHITGSLIPPDTNNRRSGSPVRPIRRIPRCKLRAYPRSDSQAGTCSKTGGASYGHETL